MSNLVYSFLMFSSLAWCTVQDTINLINTRIEICAWHWLLLTLETTLIKLQRRFDQTTSAFIGFFKKPTEWRLSNGAQFCACYASKKHSRNDRCAWLREGLVNIRASVNVFSPRVVVSLEKKSLVKIASLVYICRMVKVNTYRQIDSRVVQLWIAVSNPNRPFMFF